MAVEGKVAVVTGAAMGIGRAMTEILLKNGAKVKFVCVIQCGANIWLQNMHNQ